MGNESSKYCYPNGVLRNKYDIENQEELEIVERDITTYLISNLKLMKDNYFDSSMKNSNDIIYKIYHNIFSVDSYLSIHQYLFQDIYPEFAGQIRDESISKSNEPYFHNKTSFCYPSNIYKWLKKMLDEMKFNIRKIKTRERLLEYISYYYGEINMIHPFREGNGRTLRTYMELVVDYLNQYLDIPDMEISYSNWDSSDRKKLLQSTIVCNLSGDTKGIMECFDKVLVEKDVKKKSK